MRAMLRVKSGVWRVRTSSTAAVSERVRLHWRKVREPNTMPVTMLAEEIIAATVVGCMPRF